MSRRGERGQAAIELLAVAPVVVGVVAAVLQLLAAGAARELAGNAAGAGAAALLQGLDAEDAARDALPGWSRAHVRVTVRAQQVEVRVRPVSVVPGVAAALTASARATAGPPGDRPAPAPPSLARMEREVPGASDDPGSRSP